ncbi:MAG: PorV/PorQ family protein [Elusimicrobiota bacterium]
MTRHDNLLIAFFLFSGAVSASWAGSTGASFLKIDSDARSSAMGSAVSGSVEGIGALQRNPAGLGRLTEPQVQLSHAAWLADTRYEFVGLARPGKTGGLGVGFFHLDAGEFEGRDRDRRPTGGFSGSDAVLMTALGRRKGSLNLGAGFKVFQQRLGASFARGVALDLGGQLRPANSPLSVGAVLQNLGPPAGFERKKDPLPHTGSGGVEWTLGAAGKLSAEVRNRIGDGSFVFSSGMEYWALNALALRAGYFALPSRSMGGFKMGLGVKYRDYQLDYAVSPFEDMGFAHRFSLIIKL